MREEMQIDQFRAKQDTVRTLQATASLASEPRGMMKLYSPGVSEGFSSGVLCPNVYAGRWWAGFSGSYAPGAGAAKHTSALYLRRQETRSSNNALLHDCVLSTPYYVSTESLSSEVYVWASILMWAIEDTNEE